jgi:hypothetical protein
MPSMKTVWFAVMMGVLGLVGCGDDREPATALVVSVKTDLALSGLTVRVYKGDASSPSDTAKLVSQTPIASADIGKPIVIHKAGLDELLVVVQGQVGADVVEHAVRGRFTKQKSILLPVFLGNTCLKRACAQAGETCFAEQQGGACGICAPIALSAGMREQLEPGDEATWYPSLCPMDAGVDPIRDAGDGATADATSSDGGTDAGACTLPIGTRDECTLAPQCGCAPNQGCTLSFPVDDPEAPELACEDRGIKTVNARCRGDDECAPGLSCIGNSSIAATCLPDCSKTPDCQANQVCRPVQVRKSEDSTDYAPVKGVGVCRTLCSANEQCPEGCCADGICAAKPYCSTEGATCTSNESCDSGCCSKNVCSPKDRCGVADGARCTSNEGCGSGCCANNVCSPQASCSSLADGATCTGSAGECRGSQSAMGGVCVTVTEKDAGVGKASCFSSCKVPTDCSTGCCAPLLEGGAGICLDRAMVSATSEVTWCKPL